MENINSIPVASTVREGNVPVAVPVGNAAEATPAAAVVAEPVVTQPIVVQPVEEDEE